MNEKSVEETARLHVALDGSGHETVALLLPGFAINW